MSSLFKNVQVEGKGSGVRREAGRSQGEGFQTRSVFFTFQRLVGASTIDALQGRSEVAISGNAPCRCGRDAHAPRWSGRASPGAPLVSALRGDRGGDDRKSAIRERALSMQAGRPRSQVVGPGFPRGAPRERPTGRSGWR